MDAPPPFPRARSCAPGAATAAAAAWLLAAGCADEEPAGGWPTRNYSGTYAVEARATRNDCEAPVFAREDTLLLEVSHAYDNQAVIAISPVVSVRGRFAGDRIEARSAVALPPAAAAAAAPGDSLRYDLSLEFRADAVEGTYSVRQPAMAGLEACSQSFSVEGEQVQRRPPALLPAGG